MAINAVAPWEGELVWKGEVVKGESRNGNEWKSVEFTLKYQDSKMDEKYITFSLFGKEQVEYLMLIELGTKLRVTWWPESNKSNKTGKFYSKNNVLNFGIAKDEVKAADTKIKAPNYPQPVPPLPQSQGEPDDGDMPF